MNKNILVTGSSGFIGFNLISKLLKFNIIGIDNLNDYYDVKLKKDRLSILKKFINFQFYKIDLNDAKKLKNLFKKYKFDYVINLAAQAGVRYSIENPKSYLDNNINGFFNILDLSKEFKVKHLIFASTSSVYGSSNNFPLKETENTDRPLSFYAATKKCNEVMAYSYSNIYSLPCTAVRFFTVFGPYGRPDMSLFKFVNAIENNQKINLFNGGDHVRDFTYIDDVVSGICKLIKKPSIDRVPYNVFNIGSSRPKKLMEFLKIIEVSLNKKSKIKKLPLQAGDVHKTHASILKLKKYTGITMENNFEIGIKKFIQWYKGYYK